MTSRRTLIRAAAALPAALGAVADRGCVLERGRVVASGPATLLAGSSVVREAYLGGRKGDGTASGASEERAGPRASDAAP